MIKKVFLVTGALLFLMSGILAANFATQSADTLNESTVAEVAPTITPTPEPSPTEEPTPEPSPTEEPTPEPSPTEPTPEPSPTEPTPEPSPSPNI